MAAASEHPAVTVTPEYWDEACRHLGRRDRVMKRLIPRFGQARLHCRGDAFTTLARSIVGQQISVKAAQAVWERVSSPWGGAQAVLKPALVLKAESAQIRAAGLSVRKVEYLQDLARHFKNRQASAPSWDEMEDEAVIAELVSIRDDGLVFHFVPGGR